MSKLEEYTFKSVEYFRKKQKEVFRLAEISTLQKEMRSSYEAIGKLYYEEKGRVSDPKYALYFQRLQSLENEITMIKKKLNEVDE